MALWAIAIALSANAVILFFISTEIVGIRSTQRFRLNTEENIELYLKSLCNHLNA